MTQEPPSGSGIDLGQAVAQNAMVRPLSDFPEERVWGMLESAPDGMIMADGQGTILMVNRQVETMFGCDRGDLLGKKVEELLPNRHRQVHTAHRTRYRVEPKVRSMGEGLKLWARRADGSEFPVEVSLSPLADSHGEAVVASVRDISDRVAADAQAHLIQSTIDATHDGVFMFTPDTLRFTYVNQGAINQTGYSREELLSMSPLHIKPEFTQPMFVELLEPLLRGEVARHTFRTTHRSKTGLDVPVEIILEYPEASHPSSGRVLVALVRDITNQLAAETQVLASEAAFRTAFDEAPVGMITAHLDEAGSRIIDSVNQAFCEMLGYTAEELIGTSTATLSHPDDLASGDVAANEVRLGERRRYSAEKRYRRADGTDLWVLLNSTALEDGDSVILLNHILDISHRRATEADRDRQQRWLQGLSEIRSFLLQDGSPDMAFDLVCRHACEVSGAGMAAIGMPGPGGDFLEIAADHNGPDVASNNTTVPIDSAIRSVMESRKPLALQGGPPEDQVQAIREEVGPAIVLPLFANDEVEGILLLGRDPGAQPFSDTEVQIVESFAHQASAALELARSRHNNERLKQLEAREQIGRDLHDLVIQRLFAAGMGLQATVAQISPPAVADRILKTVEELDAAIGDLRSAIFGLSTLEAPKSVTQQLSDALDTYGERLGFRPDLRLPKDPESIPFAVLEQLVPTLSEALSNVARHASATQVMIIVTVKDRQLELKVIDNGIGLDNTVGGKGLGNMESRANRLGGTCGISTNESGGATLTWRVQL